MHARKNSRKSLVRGSTNIIGPAVATPECTQHDMKSRPIARTGTGSGTKVAAHPARMLCGWAGDTMGQLRILLSNTIKRCSDGYRACVCAKRIQYSVLDSCAIATFHSGTVHRCARTGEAQERCGVGASVDPANVEPAGTPVPVKDKMPCDHTYNSFHVDYLTRYSVLRTMLHPSVNRNAKVSDYYIGNSITTNAAADPSAGCC